MLFFLEWQTRRRKKGGRGVFAIKHDIVTKLTEMPRPLSDRIMTMRLPMTTLLLLSAWTLQHWETQMKIRRPSAASWQVLSVALLIGDFNAKIGSEIDWDWEMQLQWRASTRSVFSVRTDSDEHHVQAEGWTQNHLDASSLRTLAYDRLHHHKLSG